LTVDSISTSQLVSSLILPSFDSTAHFITTFAPSFWIKMATFAPSFHVQTIRFFKVTWKPHLYYFHTLGYVIEHGDFKAISNLT